MLNEFISSEPARGIPRFEDRPSEDRD